MSYANGARLASHITGLRPMCLLTNNSRLSRNILYLPTIRHYASRKAVLKTADDTDEEEPDQVAVASSSNTSTLEASTPTNEPARSRRGRKPKSPTSNTPIINPGSSNHSDLPSFLSYAARVNLPETTNVYIGTHYEYTVAASLSRLFLSLTRVGRTADLGIDLLGTWTVPSLPEPLRVLVQCKAEAPRPTMIRELEGAVVGAPAGWRGQGVVALLAAREEATKGVREAVRRSSLPMGFVNVTTQGMIRQFIWNAAAVDRGLEGVSVTVRYPAEKEREPEVALTWEGRPWKG